VIVIRSVVRLLAVSATVAALVVLLASLSHLEMEYPSKRLDSALGRSREIVEKCGAAIDPRMKRALHVYLGIEDFFRPAYVRQLEFVVARLGTAVGLNPVNTLGVGQITRQTYLSAIQNADPKAGATRDWTEGLADDCLSVAVLQAYARQGNISCAGDEAACTIHLACFWHTGRDEGCSAKPQDRAYFENSIAAYLRSKRSDQASTQ
jgi:hypothetical protein